MLMYIVNSYYETSLGRRPMANEISQPVGACALHIGKSTGQYISYAAPTTAVAVLSLTEIIAYCRVLTAVFLASREISF